MRSALAEYVAWVKHANSGGDVGKIAASAIKRSSAIAPSSTAVLEQEDKTPWDSTMMGHIVEWMTGDIEKDFSITGGEVNRGRREKDVAIADMNREQRWAPMTAAGCRISGIQQLSDVLTDDDNTWASRNKKTRTLSSGSTLHLTYDREFI
jgi:hypothetical protein